MSDFPCDPKFEVCEVEGANNGMPIDPELEYESIYGSALTIESYNLLWGGYTMGMLGLSAYFYRDYNYDVWNDNKYPVRYLNIAAYDKDWALQTSELTAWSKSIWALNVAHGLGFGLWALNMLLDNQGGYLHYVFFRLVQVYYIVPFVNAFLALNIIESYVQSYDEEFADSSIADVQSQQYFFRRYSADARFSSGDPNLYDTTQFTNQMLLWSGILGFWLVQSMCYLPISESYETAYKTWSHHPRQRNMDDMEDMEDN